VARLRTPADDYAVQEQQHEGAQDRKTKAPRSNPVTPGLPQIARPMKPPMNAPAMPNNIVTIQPPGSRPGISSFATCSGDEAKMIQARIP